MHLSTFKITFWGAARNLASSKKIELISCKWNTCFNFLHRNHINMYYLLLSSSSSSVVCAPAFKFYVIRKNKNDNGSQALNFELGSEEPPADLYSVNPRKSLPALFLLCCKFLTNAVLIRKD